MIIRDRILKYLEGKGISEGQALETLKEMEKNDLSCRGFDEEESAHDQHTISTLLLHSLYKSKGCFKDTDQKRLTRIQGG